MLEHFFYNQHAKQTLVNFLNDGRLPHAILLEGPYGCGKSTFARIIAAAVLCTGEDKPCGVCSSCKKVLAGQHPDLYIAQSGNRVNGFHIDEIRKIRSDAHILPNDGEYKVYILGDVHNMTEQAQNAMLKIIEEPPKHVVFILSCNNRSKMLATTLSRVTLIGLTVPTVEECQQALTQLVEGKTQEEYHRAAVLSDGNIGKGLELLGDEDKLQVLLASSTLMELACFGSEYDLMAACMKLERQRDAFVTVLEGIKDLSAQILRHKNGIKSKDEKVQELANRLTALQVVKIVDIIDMLLLYARQNVSMTLLLTKLCYTLKKVVEGVS